MADDDPSPGDPPPDDTSGHGSSSEDESEDDGPPVPSLVAGREKRSTAGTLMQSLLNRVQGDDSDGEKSDDEIAAIFADAPGEDVEFEDPDAADEDDEADDSSSDEDDQGPDAGPEGELEGERELRKQERLSKKRKLPGPLVRPMVQRKRVKIDTSASNAPSPATQAERLRKKSERTDWTPSAEDAPTRLSSRTLSVQNRQRTLESVKESKIKSAHARELNQEYQKRRKEEKGRPMTQAERLAEAARVEEENINSLSQWEEEENERVQKQKDRLAALQNRKLQGPIIRWYSGPAEWIDDKLVHVGNRRTAVDQEAENAEQEVEEEDETQEAEDATMAEAGQDGHAESTGEQPAVDSALPEEQPAIDSALTENQPAVESAPTEDQPAVDSGPKEVPDQVMANDGQDPAAKDNDQDVLVPNTQTPAADSQVHADTPDDLQNDESTHDELSASFYEKPETQPAETVIPPAEAGNEEADDMPQASAPSSPATKAPTHETGETTLDQDINVDVEPISAIEGVDPAAELPLDNQDGTNDAPQDTSVVPNGEATETAPPTSPRPQVHQTGARQLISLHNFDPTAQKDKDIQRRILFGWLPHQIPPTHRTYNKAPKDGKEPKVPKDTTVPKAPKAASTGPPRPLCVLTNQPARYRDPVSGLPYRGIAEFRALRSLLGSDAQGATPQGGQWSSLLGAWVGGGAGGKAASGVPAAFDGEEPVVEAVGGGTA